MYKISFGLMLFIFFFTTTHKSKAVQTHTSSNSLVITKDINFEIEVQSSINVGVDPVELDFGSIPRNSKQKITKTGDLKFKTAFKNDMLVKVDYDKNGDLTPDDAKYAKYQIEYANKNDEKYDDKIDIYLQRVKDRTLKQGDIKIPIVGEIREVENVRLGEYKKTINATVFVTPISPTENVINPNARGGV